MTMNAKGETRPEGTVRPAADASFLNKEGTDRRLSERRIPLAVAQFAVQEHARLRKALEIIAGGLTSDNAGPDPMSAASPLQFRSDMWTWSQRIAKNALAAPAPRESAQKLSDFPDDPMGEAINAGRTTRNMP